MLQASPHVSRSHNEEALMEQLRPDDTPYKIWPHCPASGLFKAGFNRWEIRNCARTGGGYIITMDAVSLLNHTGVCPMSKAEREGVRARLTTMLLDKRRHGEEPPLVTHKLVKEAISKRPLTVHERGDRLLRYLADREKSFGAGTRINLGGSTMSDSDLGAMAWSESTTLREVNCLLRYLIDKNWVCKAAQIFYQVTVSGNSRIADQATNVDSF